MIQYIIAAGIGAFLGSQSKKSKKSYAHGGEIKTYKFHDFSMVFSDGEKGRELTFWGKGETPEEAWEDAIQGVMSEDWDFEEKQVLNQWDEDGASSIPKWEIASSTYAEGGIVEGRYSSIYDFIDTNNLEQEANDLFGEGWEAENDIEDIRALAGENYYVGAIQIKTKRDERADDYIEVEKYAKGGKMQGYNARGDEELGMTDGKESRFQQSKKDRRDEMKGENRSARNKTYGSFKKGGYLYKESDDPDANETFNNKKEVMEFIKDFNESVETNYKSISDFNKGEEYRKITEF